MNISLDSTPSKWAIPGVRWCSLLFVVPFSTMNCVPTLTPIAALDGPWFILTPRRMHRKQQNYCMELCLMTDTWTWGLIGSERDRGSEWCVLRFIFLVMFVSTAHSLQNSAGVETNTMTYEPTFMWVEFPDLMAEGVWFGVSGALLHYRKWSPLTLLHHTACKISQ